MIQMDALSAIQFRSTFCQLPTFSSNRKHISATTNFVFCRSISAVTGHFVDNKPPICTADELHRVAVPGSDWKLALWRYTPSLKAQPRNHPLLLLSGVGTNAVGYDLSTGCSFARYMANQGFDTWIVELRGAGLSVHRDDIETLQNITSVPVTPVLMDTVNEFSSHDALSREQQSSVTNGTLSEIKTSFPKVNMGQAMVVWDESKLAKELTETLLRLSERLSGFLNDGQLRVMYAKLFDQISKLLDDAQLFERFNEIRGKISSLLEIGQNSAIASQIKDLSKKHVIVIEEGQCSVSPQLFDFQERLSTTIEDFQKQFDLIVKYHWDFDNYLEEDVPAAMEYVIAQCKPRDGKLLAIGHSMGGILLYAKLSRYGFKGKNSCLAAVVTLASSLDYTSSDSSLKLLLPLADPAQALNVPVIPLGTLLSSAYPLSAHSPHVLSWLNPQISAQNMMHPELFEKLVLNFCTIPTQLLLQLTTAFREGGLQNRNGTFYYKKHLHKTNIPILAIAGDQDLICPPKAVLETVKIIPQHLVSYKVLGQPGGPHFAHYDLVGGRAAVDEEYPCIVEFLGRHDTI